MRRIGKMKTIGLNIVQVVNESAMLMAPNPTKLTHHG
jgi:hypothetical protein